MTGVERVGLGRMERPRRLAGGRAAGGFTVPEDEARAGAATALAPPVALGGLLGLQEGSAEPDGDVPARREAGALLAELAALQRALLSGDDPATILARLDGLLGSMPSAGSPAVLALLAAVRLRARVELARRRTAQG
jgi:hypothetical protein